MIRRLFVTLLTATTLGFSDACAQTGVQAGDNVVDELFAYGEASGEIENYDFLYNEGEETLDLMTENILDEAKSHIGARYVYGSKGPKSFDCSGFTSYVFKQQNGVFIGASSRDQYALNAPVKRSEMQAGDLVFFTSPRSGRNVGHVGIIVSVDQKHDTFTFIHASTTQGVKISSSTDGYYSRRFVGVRRVL